MVLSRRARCAIRKQCRLRSEVLREAAPAQHHDWPPQGRRKQDLDHQGRGSTHPWKRDGRRAFRFGEEPERGGDQEHHA